MKKNTFCIQKYSIFHPKVYWTYQVFIRINPQLILSSCFPHKKFQTKTNGWEKALGSWMKYNWIFILISALNRNWNARRLVKMGSKRLVSFFFLYCLWAALNGLSTLCSQSPFSHHLEWCWKIVLAKKNTFLKQIVERAKCFRAHETQKHSQCCSLGRWEMEDWQWV